MNSKKDSVSPDSGVYRRIAALKQLRLDALRLEAQMDEEIQILKATKYQAAMEPLLQKCAAIISGEYEPKDSECIWSQQEDIRVAPSATDSAPVKGIPQFWLTVLKNSELLSDMIQVHDEPVLRHLADVRVVYAPFDPLRFSIEFRFSQNEFFDDAMLIKSYQMSCTPKLGDPFTFNGPYIISSNATPIQWKEGRDVTVIPLQERSGDVISQRKSFFNFFYPMSDVEFERTYDFKVAEELRDSIIPLAVLYYNDDPWLYESDSDDDYSSTSSDDSSDDSSDSDD